MRCYKALFALAATFALALPIRELKPASPVSGPTARDSIGWNRPSSLTPFISMPTPDEQFLPHHPS